MVIELFFSNKIKVFAEGVADKISLQFPSAQENKLGSKGGQRRLEAILETVMEDIERFRCEENIGWFGKARLANFFKWRLIEHGYSEGFVEALTKGVVHYLSIKRDS